MIYGIGTDLTEVGRIQKSILKGDGFKKMVFSEKEISYCEAQGNPYESFASRFAAKEAFLKALGTGWAGKIKFNEIEVQKDALGKPLIVLHGEAELAFREKNLSVIHLSMTHIKDISMATVVIEA